MAAVVLGLNARMLEKHTKTCKETAAEIPSAVYFNAVCIALGLL